MKCPGQDSRYWRPGAIFDVKCPGCGHMIEFFTDDTRRRCPNCGKEVPNPEMDFGCAAYCPYAEHCLGALPEGVVADGKLKVLKAKMLKALKEQAVKQGKSAAFSSRVMELVEEIGKKESAPLGPTLLAAFCFLEREARQEDLNSEQFESEKPGFLKDMEGAGAEEDVASEALSILDGLFAKEKEYGPSQKVILDALKIARAEYGSLKEFDPEGLFTDAAKQMLQAMKAGG